MGKLFLGSDKSGFRLKETNCGKMEKPSKNREK